MWYRVALIMNVKPLKVKILSVSFWIHFLAVLWGFYLEERASLIPVTRKNIVIRKHNNSTPMLNHMGMRNTWRCNRRSLVAAWYELYWRINCLSREHAKSRGPFGSNNFHRKFEGLKFINNFPRCLVWFVGLTSTCFIFSIIKEDSCALYFIEISLLT